MGLSPGTRLGPYEVLSAIGAGGMGEVYRARDTKLGRDVAVKVLPESVAGDPERLTRFHREAQVLASLNHPNIAHLYGLEGQEGRERQDGNPGPYLVMELVEGPTLADRITQGPIPLNEALPIAKQIAEALEAAHEQGIVHRDLKPANIKVRDDGTVKVLDFGLAKMLEVAPSGQSVPTNLTASPTLSMHATLAGVILGTAAYMAPEQARGRVVDKRADIWAFGVVLLEMLTGRRAFDPPAGSGPGDAGDEADLSMMLALVLTKEPDWTALPETTPAALRRLLARCLEKDPRRRLRDIGEARLQLSEPLTEPAAAPGTPSLPSVSAIPAWRRALPWATAGALALALVLVLMLLVPRRTAPPAATRLSAELGADVSLIGPGTGGAVALSPDGRTLVFAGQRRLQAPREAQAQLYVRRRDQLEARPLPGTEGAYSPFFSPDGQWVAFFTPGKVKKIQIDGGAAVTLCDAPSARGGTWADDGTIVFQPSSQNGASLLRVPSAGGKPEPLLSLAPGEVTQRWPQMLPGGKAVLYTTSGSITNLIDSKLVVARLPDGQRTTVQTGAFFGRYLQSGHLVYVQNSTIMAMPFDATRLSAAGQPVPVVEGVAISEALAIAQLDGANDGTLVYVRGSASGYDAPISWLDRAGATTPLRAMPANWSNPSFAPDGRRLAFDVFDSGKTDIWVYDWERDAPTRLTFDGAALEPVWTLDGRRIVFTSGRDKSAGNLYWQNADGTGDVERLTTSANLQTAGTWHPSGKAFLFTETTPTAGNDIMLLPFEGDAVSGWKVGKPTPFLTTPKGEAAPRFSPDGRWVAYQSNESGQNEVFVRPFPGPGGKWQVSTRGGILPLWSRTGSDLYYRSLDRRVMAASYTVEGASFRADKPRVWSETLVGVRRPYRSYDVHPDGKRFAIAAESQADSASDKVVFVFNFLDELRRLAPTTTGR